MNVKEFGICLKTDGVIRKMDDEDFKNFKRFDKIYWKLNLVDTVLLIIVVAVVLVSLYV
tara:strand:- start:362 stop:538 length:177 start_codon:yes stop_codon:yes gene_type:complete